MPRGRMLDSNGEVHGNGDYSLRRGESRTMSSVAYENRTLLMFIRFVHESGPTMKGV